MGLQNKKQTYLNAIEFMKSKGFKFEGNHAIKELTLMHSDRSRKSLDINDTLSLVPNIDFDKKVVFLVQPNEVKGENC